MENNELELVTKILAEDINPALESHGGGAELVEIKDHKVYLRLSGGCRGCPGARMTMKNGIERVIISKVPSITEVIDVTNHG